MPISPDEASPGVAVVVATHGRAALLRELLDALDAQTRRDVEVIVVDDDSNDDTPALLESRPVRGIRVTRRGPGQARQVGWQAARAPIVAFTDDDCIPTPGWVAALVAPIETGDADFVQGRTRPRPDQLDRVGPWSRTQHVENENRRYPMCNMAYRRDVLERLGGFRPEFTGPNTSGEDTDLGWRALEAGYRSAFAPEAVVHHVVWPSSFAAHLRDRPRWGMIVQVVRHHPEARSMAYHRYFYRASHVRALVALATLAVAGAVRRWLPPVVAGAAVAAYVARTHASPEPASRRALRLIEVFVADAVEVAVFTRASVRYRTLLL